MQGQGADQAVADVPFEAEPMPEEDMEQERKHDDVLGEVQDDFEVAEPAFVNAADVVEVIVDDDTEPMDEEDDDIDRDNEESAQQATATHPLPDDSIQQFKSHAPSPVYAVAFSVLSDTNGASAETGARTVTTAIVSGGGDDSAFRHKYTYKHTHIPADAVAVAGQSLPCEQSSSSAVFSTSTKLPVQHTDSVVAVAVRGDTVVVGSYDGSVAVYQTSNASKNTNDACELRYKLEGPTDVEWLDVHPINHAIIMAGSTDGTVWLFHEQTCLQVFVGHEAAVTAGCFGGSKIALTASTDGTVRVWNPKTGTAKHVFRLDAAVHCMDANPDTKVVAVGCEDGAVQVLQFGTKTVLHTLRHYELPMVQDNQDETMMAVPSSVEAVAFGANGWLASAGVDGNLKIWDLNTAQCRQVISCGEGCTRVCWHTTLPVVVVSTTTGQIVVVDARNGAILQTLATGSNACVNDLQAHTNVSDGRMITVTGGDDGVVRVFTIDVPSLMQHQS